jgi:hypothetical protein
MAVFRLGPEQPRVWITGGAVLSKRHDLRIRTGTKSLLTSTIDWCRT